jgi:hypothetical protein
MKKASLLLALLGSFVLTLVVFLTEASANNCTTQCNASPMCSGTNQSCYTCTSSGGAGSCNVFYSYLNYQVQIVGPGAAVAVTGALANCYFYANCTVGTASSFTSCGGAGCGGWSLYSCYPCTQGVTFGSTYTPCAGSTPCMEG